MSDLSPSTEPCACRVCGAAMDRIFQASCIPGRAPIPLVTCWSDACEMNGFTLCERDYADLDLSAYVGHRPPTAVAIAHSRA